MARISGNDIDSKLPLILWPQILSETFPNLTTIKQDIIINKYTSSSKVPLIIIGF